MPDFAASFGALRSPAVQSNPRCVGRMLENFTPDSSECARINPKRIELIDAPDFVARYRVNCDTTEGEHVGITPRSAD